MKRVEHPCFVRFLYFIFKQVQTSQSIAVPAQTPCQKNHPLSPQVNPEPAPTMTTDIHDVVGGWMQRHLSLWLDSRLLDGAHMN